MCGRFTLTTTSKAVADAFAVGDVKAASLPEWSPHYNIAPTQTVLAVREAARDATHAAAREAADHEAPAGSRELVEMRWGLIPSWAKDASIGSRLINARAETLVDKPSFRSAFRRRRCLVAADGFYEWQRRGGAKQPYWIHFCDRRVFAFAGLWERWRDPHGNDVESCTLITTAANTLMQPIHERMPVVLAPEHYDRWLDPTNQDPLALAPLLAPHPASAMEAVAVSTRVNSPRNDDPRCIEPQLEG